SRSEDPGFRQKLEAAMETYTGTRSAAAEITTSLMTIGTGALAVKHTTPGATSLGLLIAAALAQNAAIASFPLGTSLGGLWYGFFPAAASPALIGSVTGGLLAASSVFAAFAGIVADPVQRSLGLHRRRLLRLIDAIERQWLSGSG